MSVDISADIPTKYRMIRMSDDTRSTYKDTLDPLYLHLTNTWQILHQHSADTSVTWSALDTELSLLNSNTHLFSLALRNSSSLSLVGKGKRLRDGCQFPSKQWLTIHIYHQQSTDTSLTLDQYAVDCWSQRNGRGVGLVSTDITDQVSTNSGDQRSTNLNNMAIDCRLTLGQYLADICLKCTWSH